MCARACVVVYMRVRACAGACVLGNKQTRGRGYEWHEDMRAHRCAFVQMRWRTGTRVHRYTGAQPRERAGAQAREDTDPRTLTCPNARTHARVHACTRGCAHPIHVEPSPLHTPQVSSTALLYAIPSHLRVCVRACGHAGGRAGVLGCTRVPCACVSLRV